MDHFPFDSTVELLLIACAVALFAQWIRQPYTIALVLIGLIVAVTKLTPQITLTHDVAFFLILPPILFQGGLHMNLGHLRKDWALIGFLAIAGVIISTFLIGYPLHIFWHIPLDEALLFGALISPTDPVSVLAIMKKIRAPDRLRTVLEAESLFNDGTGAALFAVILAMTGNHEPFNPARALLEFSISSGGATLIGFACGWLAYKLIERMDDSLLETTVTVVLTFGTPLIAESLHCSGIIAVVVAGLVIGHRRDDCMKPKTRESVEIFWEVIDFILNSLIFLIIGVELQVVGKEQLFQFKGPILVGALTVVLSRLAIVYPTVFVHNRIAKQRLPAGWSHLLFWGGLRGTIPIILALELPDNEFRPLFLTATFGIVLFSLIVQGLTIEPLLKKLKLQS